MAYPEGLCSLKPEQILWKRLSNLLPSFFWMTDFLHVWDPGGVPYPTLTNTELYRELNSGYRMEKPDMSSDEVWVDRSSDFSICYHGRIIHNVDRKKNYFKEGLVLLCPLNTNSCFQGSRSPIVLPTRSGAWKGNSDHVKEAVEFGHWWSLMMYMAGSASEQNEANPAGRKLPAFFAEQKQTPSVSFLWNNADSSFSSQLVAMGLSLFKPPFARAPDHIFL